MDRSIQHIRFQYLHWLFVSILAIGFTAVLYYTNSNSFQRFIGAVNPLLVFFLISILGLVLFRYLISNNFLTIYKLRFHQKIRWLFLMAAGFGLIAIIIDINIYLPEDLNVLFPESLLFYPAIAFLVEIIFHLLPITLVLASLTLTFKFSDKNTAIWIALGLVAFLEPVYQVSAMIYGPYSFWALTAVFLNIWSFNCLQLLAFKRFGFISMYLMRLVFYFIWHVAWGHVRLTFLYS